MNYELFAKVMKSFLNRSPNDEYFMNTARTHLCMVNFSHVFIYYLGKLRIKRAMEIIISNIIQGNIANIT